MASQAETGGFREVGYFFDQEDRLRHKAEADQLQLKLLQYKKAAGPRNSCLFPFGDRVR